MNEVVSVRSNPQTARRPVVAFLLLGAVILSIGGFAYYKFADNRSPPDTASHLPILGEVGDFALIERDGRRVTLQTLRGRVWLADFIFASCAATCPFMTERMSVLSRELRSRGMDDVIYVSISVDPDRDTPAALRFYANLYHASPTQWLFLTGDKQQMENIAMKSFKLGKPELAPDEDQILHSSRFFLVDQASRIRGSYMALTEEEENDLMKVPRDRPMPEGEQTRLLSDVASLLGLNRETTSP